MVTLVIATLFGTLGTGLFCAEPPEISSPKKKELFAGEKWYKSQPGKEEPFVGVLKHVQRAGQFGFGRFNPYRLVIKKAGKKIDIREVYIGGKQKLLAPYVGKKVRLTGKAVNLKVEGQFHREIWPAYLEVLSTEEDKKGQASQKVKILAKAPWPFVSTNPRGSRVGKQFVIRSEEQLNKAVPQQRQEQANKLLKLLSKKMDDQAFDWNKHMLVVVTAGVRPTGGYRIDITSAAIEDKTLTLTWKVTPPKGFVTQAFTHPALVGVVNRFEGPVQFRPQKGKGGLFLPKKNRPSLPLK